MADNTTPTDTNGSGGTVDTGTTYVPPVVEKKKNFIARFFEAIVNFFKGLFGKK